MGEKKRGFFERLRDSILQPQFAHDVLTSENSGAVGYFIKLCLLISGVFLLVMLVSSYLLGGLNTVTETVDSFLGDFAIRDGRLTTSFTEPFVYDAGSSLLIVDSDPDSEILEEYSNYAGQILFLGYDAMISKTGMQVMPVTYASLGLEIDKDGVLDLIRINAWWVLVVVAAFIFIGKLISGFLFAVFIAALSLLLCSVFKVTAAFSKVYMLSLHALTGIFLVELLFMSVNWLIGTTISLPTYVGWIVTLVFMGFYLYVAGKHVNGEVDSVSEE